MKASHRAKYLKTKIPTPNLRQALRKSQEVLRVNADHLQLLISEAKDQLLVLSLASSVLAENENAHESLLTEIQSAPYTLLALIASSDLTDAKALATKVQSFLNHLQTKLSVASKTETTRLKRNAGAGLL